MAASMIKYLFVSACTFASLLSSAEAGAFRGTGGFTSAVGKMRTEELRAAVLDEVMRALGDGNRVTDQRLQNIESVLKPMFVAMPKNEHGNLEHAAARYVLHRLFEQRHAMYIKGLEPGGEAWNSSAKEIMEDHIPAFIQSLFEERLKGQGLSLQELSVLAATLEHIIHDEAVDRLKVCYEALNISTESRLTDANRKEVLDTYMMLFIMGRNASEMTPQRVKADKANIAQAYPGWHASQKFAEQVSSSVVASKLSEPDFAGAALTFNAASQVVEEIGERYGRWQDAECRDLKGELLKMEDRGSGRVQLKDFYGQALSGGAWQFTESVEYLRELGALDESDVNNPSVVIPNYVNSHSNCLASSSIFSVCCLNECESLLGHLENEIAAPEATADRIVDLVSKLPSATVSAPREISGELRNRLEEVATHHGGSVPLHGRLFAQWLHHAYPRECPFPHTSGSTNPMTADAWMQEKGVAAVTASVQQMKEHIEDLSPQKQPKPEPEPEQQQQTEKSAQKPESSQTSGAVPVSLPTSGAVPVSLPWIMDEELVVSKASAKTTQPKANASWFRNVCLAVASISALVAMAHSLISAGGTLCKSSSADGLVLPYSSKQHCC
eukprot:TRINITY_DN3287_c0_g1_i1.p1 TRINITY_DN3287_c0_g1~~TRINITY_DN3287_c0_g1_i1.p1  ORF type:complete len:650 (+),score=153.82 TRINITY_DN3287_c0_g1_i1:117-1952(+)